MLRIKLEIVEKELQFALSRAEKAEEQLKNLYRSSNYALTQSSHESTTATMVKCSHCGNYCDSAEQSPEQTSTASSTLPPPPPPPMPDFKPIPNTGCGASLRDGITSFTLNNPRESGDNVSICSNPDRKKSATGRCTYWSEMWIECVLLLLLLLMLLPLLLPRRIFVGMNRSMRACTRCLYY